MSPLTKDSSEIDRETSADHHDDVHARRDDVIVRKLPDRTVLLNGTTGHAFELNALGSAIWELLDGVRSWSEIETELAHRFAAPADRIAADLTAFRSGLEGAALIRRVRP